jgi:hypothetical protein
VPMQHSIALETYSACWCLCCCAWCVLVQHSSRTIELAIRNARIHSCVSAEQHSQCHSNTLIYIHCERECFRSRVHYCVFVLMHRLLTTSVSLYTVFLVFANLATTTMVCIYSLLSLQLAQKRWYNRWHNR